MSTIAAVPQKTTRRIAFFALAPPVLAETVHRITREARADTYSAYDIKCIGVKRAISIGSAPPQTKAHPDAHAACPGRA